jgi:hypothetical protein
VGRGTCTPMLALLKPLEGQRVVLPYDQFAYYASHHTCLFSSSSSAGRSLA